MKYDEEKIETLYLDNLSRASDLLASLPVAEGRKPTTKGLSGWVYEQTIRLCLSEELKALDSAPAIEEQVALHGRVKVDILVGKAAIEIKALGNFGNDTRKYKSYRVKAEEKGWSYFYITRCENHRAYRKAMKATFGDKRAFFLDTPGDWEIFVREVLKNC